MKYIVLVVLGVALTGVVYFQNRAPSETLEVVSDLSEQSVKTKNALKVTENPKTLIKNNAGNTPLVTLDGNQQKEPISEKRLSLDEIEEIKFKSNSTGAKEINKMKLDDLKLLLKHPIAESLKIEAIKAMSKKRGQAVSGLPNLITVLKNGSELERAYAASAIGDITQNNAAGLMALLNALKGSSVVVRKNAAKAIGEFESISSKQMAVLKRIHDHEADKRVKKKMAIALDKIRLIKERSLKYNELVEPAE